MPRTAIIVSFDRLPCAGLGCYGNEWIDTPGFDQLAATGFVFDRHIAEVVRGDGDEIAATPRLSAEWLTPLRESGVGTALYHEPHAELVIDPRAFAEVRDTGGEDGLQVAAADVPFARLVRAATMWLNTPSTSDRLLWLSSAGLPDVCRPPEGALELYVEEFAQHAVDWDSLSPEAFGRHPAIRAAYLSILDHWLGQLHAALQPQSNPVLLIVVGCEGLIWQPVPRRSPIPGSLEAQRTDVPWLMWSNDGTVMPGRSSALVQLSDLPSTVIEWLSPSSSPLALASGERAGVRGRALLGMVKGEPLQTEVGEASGPLTLTLSPEDGGEGTEKDNAPPFVVTRGPQNAVRVETATEAVIFSAAASTTEAQCFLKPEDTWDINDVAASAPDVIAAAVERLTPVEKSAATVAAEARLR